MMRLVVYILFVQALIFAQTINIVYLGLIPGGAPEHEKQIDKLLREQFTDISGAQLADYYDTELLMQKTNFFSNPYVCRSFVDALMQVSNDKTIVIWGKISSLSIKTKRSWIVMTRVFGTMDLSLTMYSLHFRDHVYIGEIKCETSILKPPVFYGEVNKYTHVSAEDREVIITSLIKQATEKSLSIVSSIIRNQLLKSGIIPKEVSEKKETSISDLFKIPSVEAPNINAEKKKAEKKPAVGKDTTKKLDK
jgi:hypothetical protein